MVENLSPAASFGNTIRKWIRQISTLWATSRSSAAAADSASPEKSRESISSVSRMTRGRYSVSQRRRRLSM